MIHSLRYLLATLILLIAWPASAQNPVTTYAGPASTTYTKTSVTLTGSSQVLLAASGARNAVTIYNPSVNANIWVDISGGTAAAETGMLVPAGYTAIITGSVVPKTAITVIGTNAQLVSVQEGH